MFVATCLLCIFWLWGENTEGKGGTGWLVGSICSFMQAQEENSGQLAHTDSYKGSHMVTNTHTYMYTYLPTHTHFGKAPLFLSLSDKGSRCLASQIPARRTRALTKSHSNPMLIL